jgi:hypothetical protein
MVYDDRLLTKSTDRKWGYIMAKLIEWTDKVAKFEMDLTVGDTPKSQVEYKISVTLDCNADWEVVRGFIAGGQSGRVAMQATLRTLDKPVLERLTREGLKINIADVKKKEAYLSDKDRAEIVRRYILSLPEHLRKDAIKGLAG